MRTSPIQYNTLVLHCSKALLFLLSDAFVWRGSCTCRYAHRACYYHWVWDLKSCFESCLGVFVWVIGLWFWFSSFVEGNRIVAIEVQWWDSISCFCKTRTPRFLATLCLYESHWIHYFLNSVTPISRSQCTAEGRITWHLLLHYITYARSLSSHHMGIASLPFVSRSCLSWSILPVSSILLCSIWNLRIIFRFLHHQVHTLFYLPASYKLHAHMEPEMTGTCISPTLRKVPSSYCENSILKSG